MPWSDYPSSVRQFSGLVQAAANARFGAAATSQIVSMAARDAGVQLGFSDFTGIAKLYGTFVAGREAGLVLGGAAEVARQAGIDRTITGGMIWSAPWSSTLGASGPGPYVLVKARYTTPTPTGPITGYFTHQYHRSEVHTLNQVLGDIQAQIDVAGPTSELTGAVADSIVSMEWTQG